MTPPKADKVFGPFFDGQDYVFADVVRVHRRLTAALDGQANSWLEKSESDDPEVASEADEKIDRAIRYAFELPAFDRTTGEGPTEGQVRDILNLFIDCLEKSKLTPEPSPTSSPPTAKPCQGCR